MRSDDGNPIAGWDERLFWLGPVFLADLIVSFEAGYLTSRMDLPGKSGERQPRSQEMLHGTRVQADARVSA